MEPTTRAKLLNALTSYDRRQSAKKHYNHYALAQYCAALQRCADMVGLGYTLRKSLITCFNGRLCDTLLRASGCEVMSREECRTGVAS